VRQIEHLAQIKTKRPKERRQPMRDRLSDYSHKLKVLRQIQSNKAHRYATINGVHAIATVIVSSLLTFMGFSGTDKITSYVNFLFTTTSARVEFVFNLLVFIFFVLVTLHLVFRLQEKQANAERAVTSLTGLINEIADVEHNPHGVEVRIIDIIRHKYNILTETIPANTDHEFLSAKKDLNLKDVRSEGGVVAATDLFDSNKQQAFLEVTIKRSELIMSILNTLRSLDSRLYLAGSLARNCIWDCLHGYKTATPIEDIDVIYLDSLSATKDHDLALEDRLRSMAQNLKWSVKNQSRMHIANGDTAYESLQVALAHFPDTPSAFALRLDAADQLEIIAPYGLDDLFRLVVAPTPPFRRKIEVYRARITAKNWIQRWPRLKVLETSSQQALPDSGIKV
jgi:hypothetical protein